MAPPLLFRLNYDIVTPGYSFKDENQMSGKKLVLAILFLLIAVGLFLQPAHFLEPDEWAYYFSAKHFQKGKFQITEEEYQRIQDETRERAREIGGSHFTQYRKMSGGIRVTEKPPGYIFLLAFFDFLNVPLLLNILAAGLTVLVLYYCGTILFDEKTGFLAALFYLFTPLSLISCYRAYLADFAASSFLACGIFLCLAAYHHATGDEGKKPHLFYLFGGMALGLSLFIRLFNLLPIVPLLCVLTFHWVRSWRNGRKIGAAKEVLAFLPGPALFLCGFFLYNHFMFGAPLTLSYAAGPTPTKWSGQGFAFEMLFSDGNISEALLVCLRNLVTYPQGMLTALPLILFAIPALVAPAKDLRRPVYIVLAGWTLLVFGLFIQTVPTSLAYYLLWTRQYLQALGALAVLSAVFLRPLPARAGYAAAGFIAFFGLAALFFYLCKIGVDPFGLGLLDFMDRYPGIWAGPGIFGSR